MLTFKKNYFLLAFFFFLVETGIALFVHDAFVRPIVGDFLVVMLVYCGVRSVLRSRVLTVATASLLFAYLVEYGQYVNFLRMIGMEQNKLLRVVLGTGFEWVDMLAYTLGTAVILLVERGLRSATPSSGPAPH